MRILFLTSAFPPESEGAATHLPELAESLQLAGHRVRVVAVVNRHEIKDTYPFRVKRISRSQFWPVRQIRVLFTLINEGRRSQVIYSYGIWWQALLAALITGRPWVIKFVGDQIWEEEIENEGTQDDISVWADSKKSLWLRMRHSLNKFLARSANQSIVSCYSLCQMLLDWGVERQKIEIIPNSLPPNPKTGEEATYLAQWKDQEAIRMICTGQIKKSKNLELILAAMEKKDSVRLVVAGDGPHLDRIKAITLEKNLGNRILFTGKIPRQDLAGYIKECDILVMSSLLGRFNYEVIEARIQKKAIFASNCGLHPDLMDQANKGWLFAPHDPQQLLDLLTNFEEKKLEGKTPETDDFFIWENYIEQTSEALNSAII
jgi:1,2-diacylglycerol 3-alpha-glucosyltransferase